MLSLSLSQSHLRQRRTYLTFEQFLTRTRTWNRTMYAARSWTRYLKRNLLGCGGKVSFLRWNQTAALVAQEPFLNGCNSNYVEEMYLSWKEDPKSVHRGSTVLYTKTMNYCLQLSVNMTELCCMVKLSFFKLFLWTSRRLPKVFFFDLLLVVIFLKTVFKETDELYPCYMIP